MASPNPIKVHVKTISGKSIVVEVDSNETVQSLKRKLEQNEGLPSNSLQLCISGKRMEDAALLNAYNITAPILALTAKADAMELSKRMHRPFAAFA